MASVFANLLSKNIQDRTIPTRTAEARKWVQTTATSAMKKPQTVITKSPTVQQSTGGDKLIGSMVLFQYQATTAKNLPYWDRFPLVFPFNFTSDGMYGINLHYLPPPHRAGLMDALMSTADGDMKSEKTKLQINYDVLQSLSRHKYIQPCVKHYLNKGLASRLVIVPATEWSIALFMPLERFQKATSKQVHEDSLRAIRGR